MVRDVRLAGIGFVQYVKLTGPGKSGKNNYVVLIGSVSANFVKISIF